MEHTKTYQEFKKNGNTRAHFYTGNYICLYRATCGAVPGFEKS